MSSNTPPPPPTPPPVAVPPPVEAPGVNPGLNPFAAATAAIFPLRTLNYLGLGCFLLAIVLLLLGAALPDWSGHPVSRGYLLALCALVLCVFLWLIYPQKLELTRIPVIDVGLQMGGPPALFFVLMYFLHLMLPTSLSSTRYYKVEYAGGGSVPVDVIRFNGADTHPKLIPVVDPQRFNSLIGLVAEFEDLQPFEVELSGEKAGDKPAIRTQKVKFERGMKTAVITLSR